LGEHFRENSGYDVNSSKSSSDTEEKEEDEGGEYSNYTMLKEKGIPNVVISV